MTVFNLFSGLHFFNLFSSSPIAIEAYPVFELILPYNSDFNPNMGVEIRQATVRDSLSWLELLQASLSGEYQDKQVYDTDWVVAELKPDSPVVTWVADNDDYLAAAVSILKTPKSQVDGSETREHIVNLGRLLYRPESIANGALSELLGALCRSADKYSQTLVTRVIASDKPIQEVLEGAGFHCLGFQPYKHLLRAREGILFYVRGIRNSGMERAPIASASTAVLPLASRALKSMNLPYALRAQDSVTGYPLEAEVKIKRAGWEQFQQAKESAKTKVMAEEVSGDYHWGQGFLKSHLDSPINSIMAIPEDEKEPSAGMAFFYDEIDHCVRIIDSFATDDLSLGVILNNVIKTARDPYSAVFIEVDILADAPQLLKCAEQLGFVPVAYLPGFYKGETHLKDVVKMVKLNMSYSLENVDLTPESALVAGMVDANLQEQKRGVAILNLLRELPIFKGLGDGELHKISHLFTQKLFNKGEQIFNRGDAGDVAYIVMRGQVDILLDVAGSPIASLKNGQILGELAFLDGSARNAIAQVAQPSILLLMKRPEFEKLTKREPHLGMVVMKNIALDLSQKIRNINSSISTAK